MRMRSPIAVGLATLLCGCPVITEELANQKTELPTVDTAADVIDEDGDGFGVETDCDDTDPAVNPSAVERCDGIDNNCDGEVDGSDSIDASTWYPDSDGDGYGAAAEPVVACEAPSGLGVDGSDCDDSDPSVNPDAYEDCATAADDNCDGYPNESGAIGCTRYYYDGDEDGSGTPSSECFCEPKDGFSAGTEDDCDDTEPSIYPGATEICDGQRNDCDGGTSLPADETDDDSDGYAECILDTSGWDGDSAVIGWEDCDDFDATVHPSAAELCDGQVNACGGSLPADEIDDDADGYAECSIDSGGWDGVSSVTGGDDCDILDDTIYPGAPEICDGLINACGGTLPADEVDDDADGYVECTIDSEGWDGASITGGDDCDDTDPGTLYDMDCDGSLAVDDCDDNDADIFPWDRDGDGIDEGCGWTVSAGTYHTCGVTSNGSVRCWGMSRDGQATPPSGTFQSVSAGQEHTCGVTISGSVECWGTDDGSYNDYGQVTDTPTTQTFQSVSAGIWHNCGVKTDGSVECWGGSDWTVTYLPGGPPVTFQSASAGGYHNCGVTSSGSVECWGSDYYGQATPPSGTFQSVSAGKYHTCGVNSSSVECWGTDDGSYNDYGQVTDTPTTGTFQSVSAGGTHTCGVTSSGSVECWGIDDGSSYDYGQVTDTPSGTFQSVSAGWNHTCGVTTAGSVECWGMDDMGQSTPP